MSARRYAREQVDEFTINKKKKKKIKAWIKKYPKGRERSAVIPALWLVQKQAGGWVPEKAVRAVAELLDMAYIRVYEVATFYTMFNLSPVGEYYVQVCGTTPCWLRGAGAIKDVCAQKIGQKTQISEDGKFSWQEVECLGACANAPMVQISHRDGDSYYEDLTPETFTELLNNLHAGKDIKEGPQNGRHTSEPLGGQMGGQLGGQLTLMDSTRAVTTATDTKKETT